MAMRIPSNKGSNYPKDAQGFANLIKAMHDRAIRDRRALEFTWSLNTAFYLGFQHLGFNPHSGELFRDIDNETYIVNRIAPFVETRVAKLTRGKPIPSVTPERHDPLTIKAAELNEHLFRHYWKVQDRDAKERTHAILMVLMGSAFKKVTWNPSVGQFVKEEKSDNQGNAMFNADGSAETEKVFLGDIECNIRSPFAILASPGATSIENADWIMDRTFKTLEEIQTDFPKLNIDNVIEHDGGMTIYEKFVNRLQSPIFSGVAGFAPTRRDANEGGILPEHKIALVIEYWKKPCKLYPKGIKATVVGNQLADFEEWPYEHQLFPFVKTDEKEQPFDFYGVSTITRLIPIQKHYNQARTQVALNGELMANGKWLVPKGSGLIDDALTDEQGEVIEYNPNLAAPHQAVIAPLPNYIMESQNQDIIDLRDVGGEREATNAPFPGLTAAVALQEAAAQANEILGPILANIEEGVEREGEMVLSLAHEFFEDPRKIKIVGQNKKLFVTIDKTDLRNQTDITIQLDSGLGESKASQRQALIDLWDRRVITDPEKFLKAFEIGSLDIVTGEQDPAEAMVLEDIEALKNGKMPQVRPFDNHIMYVKMVSNFIQSPEFRRMPEDRQEQMMQFLQIHLQALQPKQEQDQNQAAVGTPSGPQNTEGS